MKSMLRKAPKASDQDVDGDDGRSVRSSATTSTATALKMGASFVKSKLHTPFRLGKSSQGENLSPKPDDEKLIVENINALNTNPKVIPADDPAVRARFKELQNEVETERRKNMQLAKHLENEQNSSRQKLADLQSTLERERETFQSIASGDNVDEAVRLQAETIQEYQALIDALQSRVDQVTDECFASERKCESIELASKAETDALIERVTALETENASWRKQVAEQKPGGANEEAKKLEKECESLRQRLNAAETETARLKKMTETKSSAKGDSERVKMLEQENAELKRMQTVDADRAGVLQSKIISLEKELSNYVKRAQSNDEVAQLKEELTSIRGQLANKTKELSSIATAAEVELGRLEEAVKTHKKAQADAEAIAKSLQTDLIKTRDDLTKQTQYWKDKLEHDEHYQRATEAAKQLLKQKKISKAEYDQVIKAAQEAARVWNDA